MNMVLIFSDLIVWQKKKKIGKMQENNIKYNDMS